MGCGGTWVLALSLAVTVSTVVAVAVAGMPAPVRREHVSVTNSGNGPFDLKLHEQLMNYTWSSFCDPNVIMNNTCYYCSDSDFKAVGTLHDNLTEAYGFVGFNPKEQWIILSFRGSSNLDNWLADVDFIKVNINNTDARVHAGFYAAWSGLREQAAGHVSDILSIKCPKCKRIITTGHSLGSAISGLAALDFALVYEHVAGVRVEMHNFGMPRVGDKAFANVFNRAVAASTRMVHRHDIVPQLPFQDMGFHHVATEVWDQSPDTASPPSQQTYKVCDGSGEDPSCSDSVPVLEWHPKDHDYYMGTKNKHCHYDK